MISQLGVLFMKSIAHLPLGVVRGFASVLGAVLHAVVVPRRRVALRNLALCFPHWTEQQRRDVVRRHFTYFAQAWLDRSWLWHAPPEVTRERIAITGAVHELEGSGATLIFAPHFVGMDAGWTAITQQVDRKFVGIYTKQANGVVDKWMLEGRNRFESATPFGRADGVRGLVAALKRGEVMYLLPDMNFGPEESIFVPFYGVQAATVPSLSRFARLGGAKVVPIVTRLTPTGYEVRVHEAWKDFPTKDLVADTTLMNERLQGYIDEMPDQYWWVHKRFKTRPPGEPSLY